MIEPSPAAVPVTPPTVAVAYPLPEIPTTPSEASVSSTYPPAAAASVTASTIASLTSPASPAWARVFYLIWLSLSLMGTAVERAISPKIAIV